MALPSRDQNSYPKSIDRLQDGDDLRIQSSTLTEFRDNVTECRIWNRVLLFCNRLQMHRRYLYIHHGRVAALRHKHRGYTERKIAGSATPVNTGVTHLPLVLLQEIE